MSGRCDPQNLSHNPRAGRRAARSSKHVRDECNAECRDGCCARLLASAVACTGGRVEMTTGGLGRFGENYSQSRDLACGDRPPMFFWGDSTTELLPCGIRHSSHPLYYTHTRER
jgi:hypothetical protein